MSEPIKITKDEARFDRRNAGKPENKMKTQKQTTEKPETIVVSMPRTQAELYGNALCDVLCWLDGFTAGGGNYSPGTIGKLRELSIAIKEAQ